jgi:hypothetical protein
MPQSIVAGLIPSISGAYVVFFGPRNNVNNVFYKPLYVFSQFLYPLFYHIYSFRSSIGIIVYIVYNGHNKLIRNGLYCKQCIVYIVYNCLQLWSEFYMQAQLKSFLLKVCQILRLESEVVVIYTGPRAYVAEGVHGG